MTTIYTFDRFLHPYKLYGGQILSTDILSSNSCDGSIPGSSEKIIIIIQHLYSIKSLRSALHISAGSP